MRWLSYFTPTEIARFSAPFNKKIKITQYRGKKTLYVDNAEQSGGTITGMWRETIRRMQQCNNETMKQCLILGLGGGTLINILKRTYPEIEITVIEIDPVMIRIARDYFGIKSNVFLEIINADAFSWVKKNKVGKFDLIIFDLYLGTKNPVKASNRIFLLDLKELLDTEGSILYNRHYQNDPKDYEILKRYCQEIFKTVKLILSYPFSRILLLGN